MDGPRPSSRRRSLDLVGGGGEAPREVGREGAGRAERGRCRRWSMESHREGIRNVDATSADPDVSTDLTRRRLLERLAPTHPARHWRPLVRPASAASVVQSPRFGDDWWRRGVVYQIYPRSFADADGDGVGDLQGIIEHLDHLGPGGLGVDAIWLSPIYPSPGRDLGYDVSDHERVDPLFGTEADFDRLVEEAHRRGMRVVLDLVMNHTSDEHPWFVASRAGPDGAVRRLVPVARRRRVRRRRQPAAAEQLGLVLRRPGLGMGSGTRTVLLPHVPRRAARARLADPGGRGRPVRDGPGLAGSRRRRLPARRLQRRSSSTPTLPSNPVRRGSDGVGPPAPPVRPRPARLPGADRPLPCGRRRRAGPDDRRRAVRRHRSRPRPASRRRSPPRLRLDAARHRHGTPPPCGPPSRRREAAFEGRSLADRGAVESRPPRHATRLAAASGGADRRRADADAVARAAAVLLLTQRGTPFLYYGEELGSGRCRTSPRPTASIRRRRGSVLGSTGGIVRSAGRRCPGPPARRRVHARDGPGCRLGRRRRHAERRDARPPTRRRSCRSTVG